MKTIIDYNTALERHPNAVEAIREKIIEGTSKDKNTSLEDFEWSYDYCIQCQAYNITQVFDGTAQRDSQLKGEMSEDERVNDEVSRTHVALMATFKRCYARTSLSNYCPPEIENQYREGVQKDMAEKARISNLSPEERQAETNAILAELGMDPDFIGIQLQ